MFLLIQFGLKTISDAMNRSKRAAWSSNEFFAHKKNVGEEVKLKDRLTSIERRHGVVKDTLKHDIGYVKTSLKNLRKSTGHSIEALPPTPFRVDTRRYSIMPLVKRESCSTLVAFEDDHFGENWNQKGLNDYISDGIDEASLLSDDCIGHNIIYTVENSQDFENGTQGPNYKMLEGKGSNKHNEPSPMTPNMMALESNSGTPLLANRGVSTDGFYDTPGVITPITQDELKLPSTNKNQGKDLHLLSDGAGSKQRVQHTKNNNKSERKQSVSFHSTPQTSRNQENLTKDGTDFLSPLSREITSVLNDGELKRRNYVRQNSFVGIDENILAVILNKDQNDSKTETKNTRNGQNGQRKQEPLVKKKPEQLTSYLRNTRTRCRTCMERFRLNAEFQRRKLELEKEAEKEAKIRLERRESSKCFKLKESSNIFSLDDLDSVLSDGVLDFDDDDTKKTKKYEKCRPKKGYSRRRLEQLSEPRKGTKRKMLFSKGLIKKEVDTLTETHAEPQLTDREKENLRILESKIRMFLATVQRDLMPATMVHLPQREDIMKVDISHL